MLKKLYFILLLGAAAALFYFDVAERSFPPVPSQDSTGVADSTVVADSTFVIDSLSIHNAD